MAPAKKVFSNISSDDNNIIKKEANQQIMDSYNSKSPVLPWEISEEEKMKILKKFMKLVDDFNKSDEVEKTIQKFTIKELGFIYENLDYLSVKYGLEKVAATTAIISALEQRKKASEIFEEVNDAEKTSSTWPDSFLSNSFISWYFRTSVPTIKLNTRTREDSTGLVSIWDGESKATALIGFSKDPDARIWRILDDKGRYVDDINRFMKHPELHETKKRFSDEQAHRLIDVFEEFKYDWDNTRNPYVTARWLVDRGYQDVFDRIVSIKPSIGLQYMGDEAAQEAYQREGKNFISQSIVNRTNAKIRKWWFASTRFRHKGDVVVDVYKDILFDFCFYDLKNPFMRSIYQDAIENKNKGYRELDFYMGYLLLASTINIEEDGNLNKEYSRWFDNSYYAGLTKPFDEKGAKIIDDQINQYNKVKRENPDKKFHKSLDEKLCEAFEYVGVALGGIHNGENKDGVGLANKDVIDKFNSYVKGKKSLQREKHRDAKSELLGKPCNAQGSIEKFGLTAGHLEYLMVIHTLCFVMSHSALDKNHVTDVLLKILSITIEKWFDFAWNYEISWKDQSRSNPFRGMDQDSWYEIIEGTSIKRQDFPNGHGQFGPFILKHDANLEKIYYVFDNFVREEVIPELDLEYAGVVNNDQAQYLVKKFLKEKKIPWEERSFYSPTGDIVKLSDCDVGHMVAKSRGGLVYEHKFILEPKTINRGSTKVTLRDFENYYKALNVQVVLKFKEIEDKKATMDVRALQHFLGEVSAAEEVVKALHEYFKLEYDENIDTKRKYPYIKGQIYQQEAEEDRLAAG